MIKNSDILAKLSSLWFFYRWHPEVALRYLPIVDEIKKMQGQQNILEVGSGGLGIAPYLKREVTGIDLVFDPPYHPLLKRIKASAVKLPFEDSSFDISLSVDTLEHLDKKDRIKAISEMVRVARRKIIIGVPCGEEASMQDLLLIDYYRKKWGKDDPFLQEHVKYGLPKKKEIIDMIKTEAKKYKKDPQITVKGNENIVLHRFLLKGYMTKNLLVDIFFRKILLLAIPVMRRMNQEPVYRRLFLVDIF